MIIIYVSATDARRTDITTFTVTQKQYNNDPENVRIHSMIIIIIVGCTIYTG